MVDVSDWIGPAIGAVGAVGAGAFGVVGKKGSAKKQYEYQSALQAQAARMNYDYSMKYLRNSLSESPSLTRFGLESAGYNPMLAVSNGTSGSNANSFTSTGQSGSFDYSQGISEGISNAQSFQRLKNETTVADNTSKKLEAEGENLNADTANKLEENKYIGEKRKKEIANLQADTLEKEARIDNMKKQIELGFAGVNVAQEANAINAEKNDIERKGNPFRTIRDFGDKYNWSPRQFGEELGRRFAKDHFGRFYKGQ